MTIYQIPQKLFFILNSLHERELATGMGGGLEQGAVPQMNIVPVKSQ